jgi:hypothetical protein
VPAARETIVCSESRERCRAKAACWITGPLKTTPEESFWRHGQRIEELYRSAARFKWVQRLRAWLTTIGVATAHPAAFLVVGIYVTLWLIFDPRSFSWTGIATAATWIMTLFIQRAEHPDTQAIHAKLDELLRAEGKAGA